MEAVGPRFRRRLRNELLNGEAKILKEEDVKKTTYARVLPQTTTFRLSIGSSSRKREELRCAVSAEPESEP